MKRKIFRIFTGIAGIYHVLLGTIGLLCPPEILERATVLFLGTAISLDPQLSLVAKFSATYVLAFGVMLLILAYNPVKHRILVAPALALFGIRLVNKLVFFTSISSSFEVSASRNLFGVMTIFVFLAVIALTIPPKES